MLAAAAAASVSREVGLARRSGGGLRPGVSADDLRIVVGPANGGATQTQTEPRSVVHNTAGLEQVDAVGGSKTLRMM